MTDGPVRTVFLGSGAFAVPTLRRLAAHPMARIVGIVTAPPRPAGRRLAPTRTPVHEAAIELGLAPVLTPGRLRDPESVADVHHLDPEVLVLADYGQIVPAELLEVPHGALNLHPSLLPRHRGASPIPATILAGDRETAVTLMQMDEGLDTGDFIAAIPLELRGDETAPELEATLAEIAADLLSATLSPWVRGRRTAGPQPDEGATLTRPLRREDGRLDPMRPAAELERQVRAYQPWPGSFVDTTAGRIVVWRAGVDADGPPPGVIDARGIGTVDGVRLQLIEVQPAGGKRMSWEAFLRGHPGVVGSRVVASDP